MGRGRISHLPSFFSFSNLMCVTSTFLFLKFSKILSPTCCKGRLQNVVSQISIISITWALKNANTGAPSQTAASETQDKGSQQSVFEQAFQVMLLYTDKSHGHRDSFSCRASLPGVGDKRLHLPISIKQKFMPYI